MCEELFVQIVMVDKYIYARPGQQKWWKTTKIYQNSTLNINILEHSINKFRINST